MKIAMATKFAAHAHKGQLRKFTGLPYITHPLAVSELVRTYGGSQAQVEAALLHDVVEDTSVPLKMIYERFGTEVGDIVFDCTKPAASLTNDANFWSIAPVASQLVKLADIVDNTNDVRDLDREWAEVYVPQKRVIVEAMRFKMVGHPLFERAMAQVRP